MTPPAAAQKGNLVILGTIWALTRFESYFPCGVKTYKSGHHARGEKEAKKNLPDLVILGTIWTLTRFRGYFPCGITTYKSGHYARGEKEGRKNAA